MTGVPGLLHSVPTVAICRGWALLQKDEPSEALAVLLNAALSDRPLPTHDEDRLLRHLLQQQRDYVDSALRALLTKAQRMAKPSSPRRRRSVQRRGHFQRPNPVSSAMGDEEDEDSSNDFVGASGNDTTQVQEAGGEHHHQHQLRASLMEARLLRAKVHDLLDRSSQNKGVARISTVSQSGPAKASTNQRDAQKYWRLSFDKRTVDQADVYRTDIGPTLRAVDHRKRWLVRPVGDLKHGHVKSTPAPWVGAMETQRLSRSHRDHVPPSSQDWAAGHNHTKFEACHETCPGRIFQLPWQLVSRGSWHIVSDRVEPLHSSANIRTGNVREYSTRIYREFVDSRSVQSGLAEFSIDPMWNGIVDGLLEWHAQEARTRRGTKQKTTLRRLRYALKERGFANPIEAFIFFDVKGKGALSALEVRSPILSFAKAPSVTDAAVSQS